MSDLDISIKILIGLLLTIFFYEVYPFVRVIIMKKNYDEKQVKKMALWNSIVVGLSLALVSFIIDENAPMNFAPAILYYFINKLVWVNKGKKDIEEKKEQNNDNKVKVDASKKEAKDYSKRNKKDNKSNNTEHYTFICSQCGTIVKESDIKCPKCGESFDDDESISDGIDMDKIASDLNKLKKLLDNNVITKEEFEREKKKILK